MKRLDELDLKACSLKAEMQAVARSKRFIDRGESYDFSASLKYIVCEIERTFLLQQPQAAIKMLDTFLSMGERVMNRCDDSNGDISDVFREAVVLWGRAWALLPDFKEQALAKAIWAYFEKNDYGLLDDIIPAAADALRKKGLDALEQLVKSQYRDGDDSKTFHALRDIAIVRQSPEAFLAVFAFTGHKEHVSDKMDRAKLLIQCKRNAEAIVLLESIDDTDHYGRESLDWLIDLYAGENSLEKAQQLRWRGFLTRADSKYYHAYIEHVQYPSDKNKALQAALEFVKNHSHHLRAMRLFYDLGSPALAANRLRETYDQLDARFYPPLLSMSEQFLESGFPLEAILIYRCLTEEILSRSQSKYYHHAINYLKKSKQWGKQVIDWMTYPTTQVYFLELAKQHAKKPAFMRHFSLIMMID